MIAHKFHHIDFRPHHQTWSEQCDASKSGSSGSETSNKTVSAAGVSYLTNRVVSVLVWVWEGQDDLLFEENGRVLTHVLTCHLKQASLILG